MRKNQIQKLDQINEEKKLTQDIKNKIIKRILKNYLIAVDILLLFISYIMVGRLYEKNISILFYRIFSILLLWLTIYAFERAYKKDDDMLAIHSIEILFVSIISLLTPYIFIEKPTVFTLTIGIYFTVYYFIKSIFIFKNEKNFFIKEKNDISQIIKKESQDTLAQKDKENKLEKKPKRKRGRPRKTESKK